MKGGTLLLVGLIVLGGAMALLGQPLFTVVIFVLALMLYGLRLTLSKQKQRSETIEEQLSHDSRTRLRPIKRLFTEIQELVQGNQDSPAIKVIGKEAVGEAEEIYDKSARLLKLRRQIEKSLRGEYTAERDAAELELELSTAGPLERESLASALEARKMEGAHYDELQAAIVQIDGDLKQAEAGLAELKARLALSATRRDELSGSTELDEVVSRLKSLSVSFDEAEEMLKEHVS